MYTYFVSCKRQNILQLSVVFFVLPHPWVSWILSPRMSQIRQEFTETTLHTSNLWFKNAGMARHQPRLPVILKVACVRNNSSNVHAATISIFTFNSMIHCTTNSCLSRCVDIRIRTKILKDGQGKILCSLKTKVIIENILSWKKRSNIINRILPKKKIITFCNLSLRL